MARTKFVGLCSDGSQRFAESGKLLLGANMTLESYFLTDKAAQYILIGKGFHAHLSINQGAGEYVHGPVHTRIIAGSFSIFKNDMTVVYRQCSKKQLLRYLAEFDFRYNIRSNLTGHDQKP